MTLSRIAGCCQSRGGNRQACSQVVVTGKLTSNPGSALQAVVSALERDEPLNRDVLHLLEDVLSL